MNLYVVVECTRFNSFIRVDVFRSEEDAQLHVQDMEALDSNHDKQWAIYAEEIKE